MSNAQRLVFGINSWCFITWSIIVDHGQDQKNGQKIASSIQINPHPKTIEHTRKNSVYDQTPIQPKSSRKNSSRTKNSNAAVATPKDHAANCKIPLRDNNNNLSKIFDKRRTTINPEKTEYSIAGENSFRGEHNSSTNKNLSGATGENFSKIFERKGQSNPTNLAENSYRAQPYLQDKPSQPGMGTQNTPRNYLQQAIPLNPHNNNPHKPHNRVSTPVDSAIQVILQQKRTINSNNTSNRNSETKERNLMITSRNNSAKKSISIYSQNIHHENS